MAKSKVRYICTECGHEHQKWNGQCAGCGAWNTLEESIVEQTKGNSAVKLAAGSMKYRQLEEIDGVDEVRYDTGCAELNRVLGGGLVKGSLVLISGDPGIGKSTLLLQICDYLGKNLNVCYVSGEESERQIKLRAERLKVHAKGLYLASETDCEVIVSAVREHKPDVLIIDSIQTMQINELASSSGSITQVRECTNLLMRMAKTEEIPVFIVGHVNKDGGIAGPKVLEHIVDTVLYFEGDKQLTYRILRAVKNRFGSTNEIGVFEMLDRGLAEVMNPSAAMLSGRPSGVSGVCILCTMEGSRPILAEVQVLVCKTGFGTPRRVSTGFDYNRLCLILAVLEKRTGLAFGAYDVYINIIGGLRIEEPAADLAVAMALFSGLYDRAIDDDVLVFGEIGLGGEIRNVSHIHERIREGARMGFSKCIVPKAAIKSLDKETDYGIGIVGAANLKQAFRALTIKTSAETAEKRGE